VKVLLDTNALLWLLADDNKLSFSARQAIEDAAEILISEVSLWEITIKVSIGKLAPISGLSDMLCDLGFKRLGIADKYLQILELLPMLHRDPFDRMIVAQALSEHVGLVTSDILLKDYGVILIET
jgi:PIN domain nuclease of toxin-antitoxin system